MPKRIDAIKKLAKKNPRVDVDKLLESLRLTEKLRRTGIAGPGYRLAPPYSGRRIRISDDAESDPRTVRLQQR
jgi:hypothetical protein